jgi:hypothetical protein
MNESDGDMDSPAGSMDAETPGIRGARFAGSGASFARLGAARVTPGDFGGGDTLQRAVR